MRKLIITENITLDGSIEMLEDWFKHCTSRTRICSKSLAPQF